MSEKKRGRTRRVADARLPTFLKSPLPDPVKAGVAAEVEALASLRATEPNAVIPPEMLLRMIALLDVPTMVVVDLLHVLSMCVPNTKAFTRENMGALLRSKRASLGRDPTPADFAPDHPVHLFSAAYYGGIEAWAAGAPARTQKPKGHWRIEANQVEALRTFAEAHPDTPITAVNLDKAGYHALVVALRGQDLNALVSKAGLDRQLRRDPAGPENWTADAVIAAYVALCRRWDVTLSSTALEHLKGEASSLRGHAQRVFGSFGAMVAAACAAAPDLRPPNKPTAKDGTRLDSWSEVVAWNALRAAFPKADLRAHVVLPFEKTRSVDIIVGGRVYVEVLMVGLAAMATPANRTEARYARKWAVKASHYLGAWIEPILIEPEDIFVPERLALRIAEVGKELGVDPLQAAPPSGKQIRAKGTWTFETLCVVVIQVEAMVGQFPTHKQLADHGYAHAANMLKRRGMRRRVAAALGLTLINEKNIWSRERVIAELLAWVRAHGEYPSSSELLQAGRSDLLGARDRLWRGEQEALRAEVERRHGQPLARLRRQDGSYGSLTDLAALLRPLATTLGHVPTRRQCVGVGLGSAWDAMSRAHGVGAMAAQLGLPVAPRGKGRKRGPRRP